MSEEHVERPGSTDLRAFLSTTGPTWVAGAIAAGPATMASLLTGGARFGSDLLWVVVLSTAQGALAQHLATRLGLLTERGIVDVVEERVGGAWAWVLVGVVVFGFAPEVERDGTVLGGRLTRFTGVPDAAWHGVLDAHAPRAEGADRPRGPPGVGRPGRRARPPSSPTRPRDYSRPRTSSATRRTVSYSSSP